MFFGKDSASRAQNQTQGGAMPDLFAFWLYFHERQILRICSSMSDVLSIRPLRSRAR